MCGELETVDESALEMFSNGTQSNSETLNCVKIKSRFISICCPLLAGRWIKINISRAHFRWSVARYFRYIQFVEREHIFFFSLLKCEHSVSIHIICSQVSFSWNVCPEKKMQSSTSFIMRNTQLFLLFVVVLDLGKWSMNTPLLHGCWKKKSSVETRIRAPTSKGRLF